MGAAEMRTDAETDDLKAELVRLRERQAELERIVAAAREAHAFFEGRRPGFAPDYPRDVLRAAFADLDAAAGLRPVPRWRRASRSKPRRR
jgi:hypothetical protein